jgi:hypothetical protein
MYIYVYLCISDVLIDQYSVKYKYTNKNCVVVVVVVDDDDDDVAAAAAIPRVT